MNNQTTREEGDPTYDPLDNGGMCGVFVIFCGMALILITLAVLYAN